MSQSSSAPNSNLTLSPGSLYKAAQDTIYALHTAHPGAFFKLEKNSIITYLGPISDAPDLVALALYNGQVIRIIIESLKNENSEHHLFIKVEL